MDSQQPKPIGMGFRIAAIAGPLVAVGAMVAALMNPEWLPSSLVRAEPLNISFIVPGEFTARSLSDFRGRVVVVSLWRTADCPDCLMQLTALDELSRRYGREGFMAIVLSDQDSWTLAKFAPLRGMAVLAGRIHKGQADALPPERPFTFVLDREGRVRRKAPGGQAAAKLESLIERLLGR